MQRVLALVLAASLATGCTPATRQKVGAGVVLGGLLMAGVGSSELSPCVPNNTPYDNPPGHPCAEDSSSEPAHPNVGRPLLAGGLSLAFLGVVMIATGWPDHRSRVDPYPLGRRSISKSVASSPRRPSEPATQATPFPLDLTTACALFTRHLDQAELSSTDRLADYQVVSCRGPLRLAATRAQLSDVYLRDDTTLDEQRLNVCFEHRAEWVVANASAESCGATFTQVSLPSPSSDSPRAPGRLARAHRRAWIRARSCRGL